MEYRLILIANNLNIANINKIKNNLANDKAKIISANWLAQEKAYHIIYESENPLNYKIDGVDINSVLVDNSKKKLLISDMDSTIIEQECIDEIARSLGLYDRVSKITKRAMNGELDFSDALRERVALLKGLTEIDLISVLEEKITIMSGALKLVKTMKMNGARAVLVSGGFTFFTKNIAEKLGFDANYGNVLEIENGILTGKVTPPILDKNAKLEIMLAECKKINITIDDVLAVGDGANDLPMIKKAGMGVAYHAKNIVANQAEISINNNDLSSLLYLQGYKEII